jgi:hypothetical protein
MGKPPYDPRGFSDLCRATICQRQELYSLFTSTFVFLLWCKKVTALTKNLFFYKPPRTEILRCNVHGLVNIMCSY